MFKRRSRKLLMVLMAVLAFGLLAAGCGGGEETGGESAKNEEASAYPERPIEVIVGWGAGGGTDTFARAITKPASEILGQSMPVKNMSGASGSIAGDYVTQQPADGYTVWAMGSNYAVNVALGRTPHDLSAYTPIARIQQDTSMLHVNTNSQFKTLDDVIEYAKANPGKLKVGGTGAASFDEVVIALWEDAAGIDVNYVPYEKGGAMHSALAGGHLDVMFEEMGSVSSLVEEGTIKPILAFTDSKVEGYPDLPISVERGWDITLGNWRGIMVKKGTPDAIVQKLQDAFAQAYEDPGYKEFEKQRFLHLRPGYLNAEDFAKHIQENIDIYKKALIKLGYINE
ncbi:MAG: tripartite tricarboxylate transporter substrate binding protein [Desulfotomaculum sp.]|nr:tripartite tricarboxylate transporter substrate binding protein [Desulfotomaculum sp.]